MQIFIPPSQNASDLDRLPWTANAPCPEPNELKRFNERLAEIIGTFEGHPLVRVVWGGESTEFVCEQTRAKYMFASAEVPTHFKFADLLQAGKQVLVPASQAPEGILPTENPELFQWERYDVGIQRLFMEVHVPRAEAAADWELQRYVWDKALREETDRWTDRVNRVRTPEEEEGRVDVLGPCPDPFYVELFSIAAHSNRCCKGRGVTKDGLLCYGLFRMPNESDIQRVQAMLAKRERDRMFRRPGEKITEQEHQQAAKHQAEKTLARDEKLKLRTAERVQDWMKTHGHRLSTDDPSVLSHGKYHFLTPSTTDKEKRAA